MANLNLLGIDPELQALMKAEKSGREPHAYRSPIYPHKNSKYPWHKMEVGESFVVYGIDRVKLLNNLTSCRWHHEQKTGKKFKLHCMTFGVEVTRTA